MPSGYTREHVSRSSGIRDAGADKIAASGRRGDTARSGYSIRVNDQWRICFRWSEGKAYDVEVVDYH